MTTGYTASKPKDTLTPTEYDLDVGDDDVLVRVTHCGVCHTDVHLVDGDFGDVFPLVPGHEIVGLIERAGANVSLQEGDRVGIGWQSDSCGECEFCLNDREAYCAQSQATCVGRKGGFATHVVADERFCIPIPQELDSAKAAPMLCGGITVFSPLLRFADEGSQVAVIGIGGLGHFAIQFASALGCHVTAHSTSPEKEQEALDLGADAFSTDAPEPRSYDLIISTAPAWPDMESFLASLRPEGQFVQVGLTDGPVEVSSRQLIMGSKCLCGSQIGHPATIRKMLSLAAEHGIGAVVEEYPFEQVNEALDVTRRGDARYRTVLVADKE